MNGSIAAAPPSGHSASDAEMIRLTHEALDLLLSKWKVDLIYLLASGVRRHSRLHDALRGVSKKVLTETLRGLERDGLVRRQIYAEVPARVEYSLTKLGWSLTQPMMSLYEWAEQHVDEVRDAQGRYGNPAPSHTAVRRLPSAAA
jgi:DNA-binding HxlR family transcriptional regulator